MLHLYYVSNVELLIKTKVYSVPPFIVSTHNVVDVYYSKLHQKPLSKLVQRLAKAYNIPKEYTPNVSKMKNFGALQFLCHKRYYEKSLSKYIRNSR